MSVLPLARGPIWTVVERLFSETELLIELREDALEAPDHDLDTLHNAIERRLRAQIEGLCFAGRDAIARVVEPALDTTELGKGLGAATCLSILAVGSSDDCERVIALLDPASSFDAERSPAELSGFREGVVVGFVMTERHGVDEWLESHIANAMLRDDGTRLAGLVAALAGRGRAPATLTSLLARPEPQVLASAAVAARFVNDPNSATMLALLANHEEPQVQAAAIETALIRQLPGAWSVTRYWAFEAPVCPFRRRALVWAALLGAPDVHASLLERMAEAEDPSELGDLLWAASFCGRPGAIGLAMPWLEDPELGPRAAELICAIAGLGEDERLWIEGPPPGPEDGLPPLELDQLDADLSLRPEQLLPRPNPEVFAEWWPREARRLSAVPRMLHGRPWSVEGLLERLRHGPLRRRHPLALELAIRSGGRLAIDTRGWVHSQLRALQSCTADANVFVGGLGSST